MHYDTCLPSETNKNDYGLMYNAFILTIIYLRNVNEMEENYPTVVHVTVSQRSYLPFSWIPPQWMISPVIEGTITSACFFDSYR